MNLFSIAWKNIRQRLLSSSLTSLSLALGVMLMISVLVIHGIVDRMFSQRSIGYSLIVGPKGSDLQLVMSAVYRIQPPIENLPYRFYEQVKEMPGVVEAVPIAMGDFTKPEEGAFPIVGTNERFFELPYAPGKEFLIKGSTYRDPFDAIVGALVARKNNWTIGSTFQLVHGGAEADHVHNEVFTVKGILKATGTPNDRTVFVHLNGFYAVEGHDKPLEEAIDREEKFFGQSFPEHDDLRKLIEKQKANPNVHIHGPTSITQKEVTAILLKMKSPTAAFMLSGDFKEGFQAQAVNPIFPMKRLMDDLVGNVRQVLVIMTGLIIVVSGVGIFVSIYNSMSDRKREIAVMRALGASRRSVFSIILAESVLLCVVGGILGILLGHGLVFFAAPIVEARSGLLIEPFAFEPTELILIPALMVLASLVGFIPGMTAYRTDVARALVD